MKVEGCVFISTPDECSGIISGECNAVDSIKLTCPSTYMHTMLRPDMVLGLMDMFRREL